MNTVNRRSVLLYALLVIILLSLVDGTIPASEDDPIEPTHSSADEMRDDIDSEKQESVWELLEMTKGLGGIPQSEQRYIKHVKITFIAKDASPLKVGFVGKKPLVYETDDPHVLDAITKFLWFPLRHAMSERFQRHISIGGAYDVGTMVVTTNKDAFTIYITQHGFQLGEDLYVDSLFYSWGLAHFLDDLCVHKLGIHIPPDIMRHLTGESRANGEKKILQRLNELRRKDLEGAKKVERAGGTDERG